MQIPQNAKKVISLLNEAGFSAYIVGGFIRDFVFEKLCSPPFSNLGICATDIDITTCAKPQQVIEVFSKTKNIKIIPTGLKHGTLTLILYDENDYVEATYEITTYRVDGVYIDHRRPEQIIFTDDIKLDLSRRDFTINAMASANGVDIIDPFCGIDDLRASLIRCVGDAKTRFEEDGLRVLRALRFASKLDFEIEENTKKALYDCCALLKFISKERLSVELLKLLSGPGAISVTHEYIDILRVPFPKIKPLKKNVPFPFNASIALCMVFDDPTSVGYSAMKISKTISKNAEFLIKNKDITPPDNIKDCALLIYKFGQSKVELLSIVHEFSDLFSQTLQSGIPTSLATLGTDGFDLVKLGVPKKEIGCELDRILREKIKNWQI